MSLWLDSVNNSQPSIDTRLNNISDFACSSRCFVSFIDGHVKAVLFQVKRQYEKNQATKFLVIGNTPTATTSWSGFAAGHQAQLF